MATPTRRERKRVSVPWPRVSRSSSVVTVSGLSSLAKPAARRENVRMTNDEFTLEQVSAGRPAGSATRPSSRSPSTGGGTPPDDWLARHLPGPLRRERERWYTPERSTRLVHWVRFSLVLVALVDGAAHLFASPAKSPEVTLWLDGEVVLYVLIAMIYLLGLRMWYLPAVAYSVLNLILFFVSGFVAIPGITTAALTGHLAFSHYFFGRAFSVGAWIYLLLVGAIMLRADPGSRLNELLRDS
jgi:hypothetical protein